MCVQIPNYLHQAQVYQILHEGYQPIWRLRGGPLLIYLLALWTVTALLPVCKNDLKYVEGASRPSREKPGHAGQGFQPREVPRLKNEDF